MLQIYFSIKLNKSSAVEFRSGANLVDHRRPRGRARKHAHPATCVEVAFRDRNLDNICFRGCVNLATAEFDAEITQPLRYNFGLLRTRQNVHPCPIQQSTLHSAFLSGLSPLSHSVKSFDTFRLLLFYGSTSYTVGRPLSHDVLFSFGRSCYQLGCTVIGARMSHRK